MLSLKYTMKFNIISRGEDLATLQEASLVENLIVIDVYAYQFQIQFEGEKVDYFNLKIGEQSIIDILSAKVGRDKLFEYIVIEKGQITCQPFMYFEDGAIGEVLLEIEVNGKIMTEKVNVESRRLDKQQYEFMLNYIAERYYHSLKSSSFYRKGTQIQETHSIDDFCQWVTLFCHSIDTVIPHLNISHYKEYQHVAFNTITKIDVPEIKRLAQQPTHFYQQGKMYLPRYVHAYVFESSANIVENQYLLFWLQEINYKLGLLQHKVEKQETELVQGTRKEKRFFDDIQLQQIIQDKKQLKNTSKIIQENQQKLYEQGIEAKMGYYLPSVFKENVYYAQILKNYNHITTHYETVWRRDVAPVPIRNNWELFEKFTYFYLLELIQNLPDFISEQESEGESIFEGSIKKVFLKAKDTELEEKIELVYHFDQNENNDIGMVQCVYTQHNLTPDFVLKYTKNRHSKYFVVDSKFTYFKNAEEKARELKDKYLNAFVTEENRYIDGVFALTPSYQYRLEVMNKAHNSRKPRNYPIYGWATIPVTEKPKDMYKNIITELMVL